MEYGRGHVERHRSAVDSGASPSGASGVRLASCSQGGGVFAAQRGEQHVSNAGFPAVLEREEECHRTLVSHTDADDVPHWQRTVAQRNPFSDRLERWESHARRLRHAADPSALEQQQAYKKRRKVDFECASSCDDFLIYEWEQDWSPKPCLDGEDDDTEAPLPRHVDKGKCAAATFNPLNTAPSDGRGAQVLCPRASLSGKDPELMTPVSQDELPPEFPSDLLVVLEKLVDFARDKHARSYRPEMMGFLAQRALMYASLLLRLRSSTSLEPMDSTTDELSEVQTLKKYKHYSKRIKHGHIVLPDRTTLECIILRVYEESGKVPYANCAWAVGTSCPSSWTRTRVKDARRAAAEDRARRTIQDSESTSASEADTAPVLDTNAFALPNKPIDESNAGHALLVAMGWTAGTGLGKTGEGIVDPVLIKYRPSRKGLG
ncbi:G patch domain-containing protein 2 [Porphyridium purpureum]|uniref:G patch domain-containing protein 2 n=1 Tax=Porphyridium purpureum TaxID=35688 RepID=A0A5J4YUQ9_PORPP|nr:G patch domain-containing protein 2 [Porphyridium purpureum]|eukprot:POR6150..scf227_4